MDKIGQFLERGFFGGIVLAAAFAGAAVFLYLVYRLIKFLQPTNFPTAFICRFLKLPDFVRPGILTCIAYYFAFIYPQTHHEERLIFPNIQIKV